MKQESSELYLVAYVMATGVPLAGQHREGRRVVFHFDLDTEAWEQLARDFHSGDGMISGQKMANAVKAVKTLLTVT